MRFRDLSIEARAIHQEFCNLLITVVHTPEHHPFVSDFIYVSYPHRDIFSYPHIKEFDNIVSAGGRHMRRHRDGDRYARDEMFFDVDDYKDTHPENLAAYPLTDELIEHAMVADQHNVIQYLRRNRHITPETRAKYGLGPLVYCTHDEVEPGSLRDIATRFSRQIEADKKQLAHRRTADVFALIVMMCDEFIVLDP